MARWPRLLPVLAALLVFANTLGHGFVYDDHKQIVENHLIREPGRLGEALTSDVWAFKGERAEAWSNYWRPAFVAWLALNDRLFALEPVGWHAANVLLHALVVALLGLALARLAQFLGEAPSRLALGVALLFAVHPAHVESVAWVSGSPDLLAAAFLLGALLCQLAREGEPARWQQALGLGLFALALLSKEIAILFPVLWAVAVALRARGRGESWPGTLARAARAALPLLALAVAFLLLRHRVLGMVEVETPWHHGPFELLLTAPSLLTFYLGQALAPLTIGPSYPLRAVSLANLGLTNFWLPLAAVAAFIWIGYATSRRSRLAAFGWALFALPLLPALNINAFLPEHLTHDRYMYLSVAGIWLALFATYRRFVTVPVLLVIGVALSLQSLRANAIWASDLALWQRGVETDPGSAFNWAQLGNALRRAGRTDEALAALERALAITPVTNALLDRAEIRGTRGELAAAMADLRTIQTAQPDNPQPYERLAGLLQAQGKLEEAMAELRAGRERVPYQRCAMTSNLAVLLYLSGKKDEALAELRAVQGLVGREPTPACARAAFHLGALAGELGRGEEARAAFERFLAGTLHARDAATEELRRRARAALAAP